MEGGGGLTVYFDPFPLSNATVQSLPSPLHLPSFKSTDRPGDWGWRRRWRGCGCCSFLSTATARPHRSHALSLTRFPFPLFLPFVYFPSGSGPLALAASRRPQGRTGRRRSYGHACRLAGALRWRREGAGRREEEKANAILPLPARRARRQSTDVTQCEQARGNGPLFLLPSSSVRDLLLSLERKGEEGEAREIDIDMNHMIAIIGTYFFSKETSQTHTFSCNFPIPVELQAV